MLQEGRLLKRSRGLRKLKQRYVALFFWRKPARLILNTYKGEGIGPKCTESLDLSPGPPVVAIEATLTFYLKARPVGEAIQEFKFRAESETDFQRWLEVLESAR